ncbi:helix-turn-helix domain-containing protein [Aliiruegeria lutimaris]|uniref:helix-turn-helix domain-containing protein n=1 Tax=Aliiruegeria lutimaris TaxID=571298 RepID=UPI000B897096
MSMLTGSQIRAARGALNWSVSELSRRSGVSGSTIKRVEASEGTPASTTANVNAIRSTLESAGIEFIGTPNDAPGIRIHKIDAPGSDE